MKINFSDNNYQQLTCIPLLRTVRDKSDGQQHSMYDFIYFDGSLPLCAAAARLMLSPSNMKCFN